MHPAQAEDTTQQSERSRPVTMLSLPTDIRLVIYDWVFFSTTLQAYLEDSSAVESPNEHADTGEPDLDNDDDISREALPMFRPPELREKLNLVCKAFNTEIGRSWHSKTTYCFPSTVAFADVLGQWQSSWKLETLRHAYVHSYPLPLNTLDGSSYVTHSIDDALTIFPGLRLDVLEVENVWLQPDGEEVEGWCLGMTLAEVTCLLVSNGWKQLKYISGTLGFLEKQLQTIHQRVEQDVKEKRQEKNFAYKIASVRPRLSSLVTYHVGGGTTEDDTPEDKAEVAQWEAQNPSWSTPTEKAVQVWAKRGTDDFASDGEGRSKCLTELMGHFASWNNLRSSSGTLVDYATDDNFCAHL